MVATSLRAGSLAVISVNTDDPSGTQADSISFVLLQAIGSGTQIHFTDRTWTPTNGSTALNAGSFSAGVGAEGTYTYSAAGDLPAGTIVTIPTATLAAAGINLDDAGETIYVYQGTVNAPTSFLYALDIADGNTTFEESLVNTGLTLGVHTAAIDDDNGTYGDIGHNTNIAQLLANISDTANNWVTNVNSPQLSPSGTTPVSGGVQTVPGAFFDAPTQSVWAAISGGGAGLSRIFNHGNNIGTEQAVAFQNTPNPATGFFHPNDIVFDTVHGLFFVADSDTGNRRILQGNIADLFNPGLPTPTLTVLWSNNDPTTAGGQVNGIAIDVDHATGQGALYFVNQKNFNRIVYDHDGTSPTNQTATLLANLGATDFANEIALDLARNRAFVLSTASNTEAIAVPPGTPGAIRDPSVPENDPNAYYIIGTNVTNNEIYMVGGLDRTDTSTAGTTLTKLDLDLAGAGTDLPGSKGLLQGLDVDTTTGLVYFVTQQINLGVAGEKGGIYRIDPTSNVLTQLYEEGNATDYGFEYIDVDSATGRYYVSEVSFADLNGGNGNGPNTSSILTGTIAGGTPTVFAQVGNVNASGPLGLIVNNAPTLIGVGNLNLAVIEASSARNSGETSRVTLFSAITISDIDTPNTGDELAGARVRISGNLQTGLQAQRPSHQDILTINGTQSGTTASGITYSYNGANGTMTLSGPATVAEYKAALESVQFSTSGDDITAYGNAQSRTISASVFDGLNYSDEISATVSITAINDAPENSVGGTPTYFEDTTGSAGSVVVPLAAPVNAVTGLVVFDVDADPAVDQFEVSLNVNVGTLTVRTDVVGGPTIADNGTSTVTLFGTQNQINALLSAMSPLVPAGTQGNAQAIQPAPNGIVYTPPANFNGAATLTMTTNDMGNEGNDPANGTGTGTTEEDIDTKILDIDDVNDAPTVVNGTTEAHPTILEDTPRTDVNALTVQQLFGGHFSDAIDVQVTQANPTGSPGDTLAGIAIVGATSSAVGAWQFYNGTVWVNINAGTMAAATTVAAGTKIRFNPALDQNGTAPALTAHLVEFNGMGVSNNGTINLTFGLEIPGGQGRTSIGTVTLTQEITPVNDAPVIANLSGDNQSFFEGDPAILVDSGPTFNSITDVDSADFNGGSLTVSVIGGDTAEDVLGISPGGLITVVGTAVSYNNVALGTITSDGTAGNPLTIDFTGTASKAAVQALITRITYLNTDTDDPTGSSRGINFVLNDGDGNANGGDPTAEVTALILVRPINDAPVLVTSVGQTAFDEGVNVTSVPKAVDPALTFSDVDDTLFNSAVISITAGFESTDVLGFTPGAAYGNIALTSYTNGVLTLTSAGGTATLAEWQAALRSVTYTSTSQEPSEANRTVSFKINDGGLDSNVGTKVVLVNAQNDAPTGTSATQTIAEDATVEIKEGILGFSDTDGDSFFGVRLPEAPTGGKIFFDGGTGPAEVTTFGGGTTYLKADLDAGKLTFVPTQHLAGPAAASFKFVVVDDGGTAQAGVNADTIARTLTFDITPVNDEPEGSDDNSATVVDDQIHTFTIANFQDGLFDVEGNLLSGVQLVALPSSSDGVISYDPDGAAPAAPIAANAIFTIADLMQGRLTFDPAATATAKQVTLTFKAIDNGTPPATDQTPNTFTLNVTPANQPPTLDLDGNTGSFDYTAAYTENDAAGVAIGDAAAIGDTDAGDMIESMVVTITDPRAGDAIAFGDTSGFTVTPSGTVGTQLVYTVTGSGTAAQYQAILASARYSSSSDNPTLQGTDPARTITVVVSDGSANSAVRTATVNITATPDKPVGLDNTLGVTEDSFRGLGSGSFSFSDPDGDDFLSVTITDVTGGSLFYDADGGDHSDAIEVTAASSTYTLADFGNGDKLLFRPTTNSNASGSLSFTLKDDSGAANGADTSEPKTLTFTVTPVNDHPDLQLSSTGPSQTLEYTENDGAVAIAPSAILTDIDSANFGGGSLKVSLGMTGQTGDELGIKDAGGITFANGEVSYNGTVIGTVNGGGAGGGDLDVSFDADATVEAVDKLIEAISFRNTSENPVTTQRTVTYRVIDGDGGDDTGNAAAVINVTRANDAPTAGAETTLAAIVEDATDPAGATVADLFGAQFSDVDGDTLAGVAITVNGSDARGEWQYFNGTDWFTVGEVSEAAALVVAAGDKLRFVPAVNYNGAAPTLSAHLIDSSGGAVTTGTTPDVSANGGTTAISDTPTVLKHSVTAFNDTPSVSNGDPVTAAEQTFVVVNAATTIADVDLDPLNGGAGDYTGAVLSLSRASGPNVEDAFKIENGAGFTVSGDKLLDANGDEFATVSLTSPGQIVVSFTSLEAIATTALVNAVARAVQYRNLNDAPPATVEVVTVLLDGSPSNGQGPNNSFVDAIGLGGTVITITPVNDSPSIDLDGAGSADTAALAYTENDGVKAIAPSATVADPDLPANYDGGTLTVSFASGAQVDDMLGLAGSGSFSVDENGLFYPTIVPDENGNPVPGRVYFASYGGGDVSSPLTISFNANATPALVRDVVRSIGFVNFSDNPVAGTRTISYVLTDGDGGTSAPVNATVTLSAVDDNPTLNDDNLFTAENMVLTGDLFVDNGNGNDFDPDGPPFQITHVNGQALVGGTISLDLATGAKVTVNSNGTFSYNPNGKFVTLTDNSSGAVNISAPDSFDYTISGGDTATAKVTVQGVAGPGDVLAGDGEDNVITGTPQGDVFLLQQGGDDKAYGLGSSDLFVFRAAMTSADEVDGGEAVDQISLQGDYATVPLTLGTKVVNVEFLLLNAGNDTRRGDPGTNFYSYNITTVTENVAPGVQMRIDAARLRAGENFTFNGSAETDGGTFRIYGGEGVDNLTGGSGSDVILFGNGAFGASDIVNGGAGAARDQLALRGNYTLTFGSAQIVSIESLLLQSGRDARDNTDYQYDITMVDANVVGGSITIDAGQLRAAETLKFNGSAEDDATFRIFGGDGNDELTGGQLGDIITGGLGSDSMYGGGGNDRFVFRTTADSNGAVGRDAIQDFATGDLIDLTRIDANSNTGGDDAFSFIGSANFSNTAGELRVADQGGGIWLVQGDTDGIGGSDFEFFMVTAVPPTQGDFLL